MLADFLAANILYRETKPNLPAEIFAITSFSCHQIHGDGCHTHLDPSYAFCPQCGRATATLRADASPAVTFTGTTNSASLPLRSQGQRPLVFSARLETSSPLRIKGREAALESCSSQTQKPASLSETLFPFPLVWTGSAPPPVEPPLQIPLFLCSHDGMPHCEFDIEPANRARVWEPIYMVIASPRPAKLEIETEVLLLGGRSRQRRLTLHNSGEMPLTLRPPLLPVNFEIEATTKEAGEWTIGPGARKSWTVRALNHARVGQSKISLQTAAGTVVL